VRAGTGFCAALGALVRRGRAGRAHPFTPIAPVTTGANGGKGCGQNHHLMRRAEKGAAMATTGCERRKRVRACTGRSKLPLPLANTTKHPPAHPFTPSAPVTTGANGGKGCGRGHSQVRTAEKGAGVATPRCERRERVRARICIQAPAALIGISAAGLLRGANVVFHIAQTGAFGFARDRGA
jgi:hypothetical protein